jgi:hypothetical protein
VRGRHEEEVEVSGWAGLEYALVTDVDRIAYDVRKRTGYLYTPEVCCCDMGGAIDLFMRIDSQVQRIETYSGPEPDTRYIRRNGEWIAERRVQC